MAAPYPQMQQQQQQQQQPTVNVVSMGNAPQTNREYLSRSATSAVKGMAISQIVMGGLCFLFEMILMILYHENKYHSENYINGYIGGGIWNGAVLIITGGIGIGAAKYNNACWVVAYMILNILCSAIFMPTLIGLASGATSQSNCYYYYYYYYSPSSCNESLKGANIALNVFILLMALAQFIISIVASAFCCGATCCRNNGRTVQTVHYIPPGQQQQQQVMSYNMTPGTTYPSMQVQYYPTQASVATYPVAQSQAFYTTPQGQAVYSASAYQPAGPPAYYTTQTTTTPGQSLDATMSPAEQPQTKY